MLNVASSGLLHGRLIHVCNILIKVIIFKTISCNSDFEDINT